MSQKASNKVEGEGSYEGTRRYNEGVRKTAKDDKRVQAAAQRAKKAIEDPAENKKLKEAEEKGRSRAKS